tara:strand:- start:18 stop:1730 length:1713 start_codon:yes stop_codon:yes gene_type:complete
MPGGLLNLIAYGNQNIILNGNPKKTFFKSVYMKHTNFGIQKFRLDYQGSRDIDPNNDSLYKFKIPRNADLLLDSYLCFTLPDIWSPIWPPTAIGDIWKPYHFKWINHIGTSLIKNVKVMIGSQTIQEYPGEYIHCVVERDFNESKKKLFDTMTGNIQEIHSPEVYNIDLVNNYPNAIYRDQNVGQEPSIRGRKIYVPLNPWFMNNTQMSVPLVALQYNELTIEITLKPIKEMFTINNVAEIIGNDLSNSYIIKDSNLFTRIQPNFSDERHLLYRFLQPPASLELYESDYGNKITNWNADVHLISNYCFLTKEENTVFALNEQKYLMKDVKYSIHYNLAGTNKVKIDTNALVSSWMWFFRRSDVYERNQWSNYTNWKTINKPSTLVEPSDIGATIRIPYYEPVVFPSENVILHTTERTEIEYVNNLFTPVFSQENEKYILQNFSILIDGKYREVNHEAGIYNYIEPYRASNLSNDIGLYCYNFGINTTDMYQPSGAINLSRFNKIEFEITTIEPQIDPSSEFFTICDEAGQIVGVSKDQSQYLYTYEMHLFEERYNILRILSGNGGLLYAR